MMESKELVTSQRESGENVLDAIKVSLEFLTTAKPRTHQIEDASAEPIQLSHHSARLNVNDTHGEIIADGSQETTIAMQSDRDSGGGKN